MLHLNTVLSIFNKSSSQTKTHKTLNKQFVLNILTAKEICRSINVPNFKSKYFFPYKKLSKQFNKTEINEVQTLTSSCR